MPTVVANSPAHSGPRLQAQLTRLGMPTLLVAILGRATLPNLLSYLAHGRPPPSVPVEPTSLALGVSSSFSLLSIAALALVVLGRPGTHARTVVTTWLCYATLAAISSYHGDHIAATTAVVSLMGLLAVSRAPSDLEAVTRLAVRMLVVVMWLCLLLAALRPDIARYTGSAGTWLSRDARLAGPFSTANEAANLAAVTIILILSRWRLCSDRRVVGLGASAGVLLLTQSYTSWLACAVGCAVVLSSPRPGSARRIAIGPLVAASVGVFLILRVIARAERAADLTSVNGRQRVWTYVLQRWSEAPLLGHGSGVWRRLILEQQVPTWAVHAHNQGLNTLYVGGILGLLALVLALCVSARLAGRQWRLATSAAAGLLALELVRCYAEAPFELLAGGANLFVTVLVVAMLNGVSARDVSVDRPPA